MSGINILIVEGHEGDRAFLGNCLSEAPHSNFILKWEADYDSGLEAISSGEHDICLLDSRLGERYGLTFIREAANRGLRTPVLFLSSTGDFETERLAMKDA